MDKCEWIDGGIMRCKNSIDAFGFVSAGEKCTTLSVKYSSGPDAYNFKFCPFCGADIRKPEPEVIIKRSGGTWVARYDGVDYLATDPAEAKSEHCLMTLFNNCGHDIKCAKPISEIEITDEIAKLRPMVRGKEDLYMLYGVMNHSRNSYIVINIDAETMKLNKIRLATVSDLEEK